MNRIEGIPEPRPPKRVEPTPRIQDKRVRKVDDTLDKNQPDKLQTDTLELSEEYQKTLEDTKKDINEAFS